MPANVGIIRVTGANASSFTVDITGNNTVANADDMAYTTATGSNNPVRIPASGTTNYSYWVTTRLIAYTTPSGTINNIRWYTDGGNNFSTTAATISAVAGQTQTYFQAGGTAGTSGLQLTAAVNTGLYANPVDPFTYTVGSPLAVTGAITFNSVGQFGNYVVYQLVVTHGNSPGVTNQETFTWLYDET